MLEITELNIYPVKSLQGISLLKFELGVRGLKYDRSWMVVDSNYHFITQRNRPKMATIKTSLEDDCLVLEHNSISPLEIKLSKSIGERRSVKVWNDQCWAVDEGIKASNWLTEVLGQKENMELRLVKFDGKFERKVDERYLKGEYSHTSFSDGFPYLVTSEESLDRLNEMLISKGSKPVRMERFRSNIVVKGGEPLDENNYESLTETESKYSLGIRKPCQRCVITTLDQKTSKVIEPKEPLRTLIQMNSFSERHEAYFGQNATLLNGDGEIISVGDKLIVKHKK